MKHVRLDMQVLFSPSTPNYKQMETKLQLLKAQEHANYEDWLVHSL